MSRALSRHLCLFFVLAAAIGGCGKESENAPPTDIPVASLAGVYAGTFPCEGCPGIPATLWLRTDSTFFFKQAYPKTEERDAMDVYGLGRWSWQAGEQVLVLRGAGPARVFTRADAGELLMQTHTGLEHRLHWNPVQTRFTDSIAMRGIMRPGGEGMWFSECLTGLEAPVQTGGDYRRFVHQYRSTASRGKPAFVELDGRFNWSDNASPQSFRIDRFITIKPDGAC
jgi:hypothetical protein